VTALSDTELNPLIHVPARLRIMVTLAAVEARDAILFPQLRELTGLTAGNLITHLRKLEDAGYLTTSKSGEGQTSRTLVQITNVGRAELDAYRSALSVLLGTV
jgi:DNA-binding MarR family transcriptional regulator